MQRILVTGGAGFIGSHLGERLLGRGDELVVLDNFNDFYDPALKRANAALLERATLVEGDVRDRALVAALLREHEPDAVVHLAAMAGVRPSVEDPLLYQDVNVRGTLVLLEELRRRPATRLVFASSSSVYGARDRIPFSEADDIPHPVSPYAATKRAGELLCYTHHHLYGTPISCLRFFTVYGPRQRPEMAIHAFVRLCLARQPIPFFGDGTTRRDYTYIDDIVTGVMAALHYRASHYEVINLGNNRTVSLAELVAALERALGRQAVLDRQPEQPGDVPQTWADVGKAARLLGYAPATALSDGLQKFTGWLRAQAHSST